LEKAKPMKLRANRASDVRATRRAPNRTAKNPTRGPANTTTAEVTGIPAMIWPIVHPKLFIRKGARMPVV